MSDAYLGEIRVFGFNFAPHGWALCDGAILPINQNQSLYSLLGTTYGGDGRTSFALPDLRGRVPMHRSDAHTLGQSGGVEGVVLNMQQVPTHTHGMSFFATSDAANQLSAQDHVFATPSQTVGAIYTGTEVAPDTTLRPQAITTVGGQPHDNMMPFQTLSFCIALTGLFPPRN